MANVRSGTAKVQLTNCKKHSRSPSTYIGHLDKYSCAVNQAQ